MVKNTDERQAAKGERTLFDGIMEFLRVVYRFRWMIVSIVGVATLATAAYCLVSIRLPPDRSPMPNVYTAEATLLVQANYQSDITASMLSAMGINQQGGAGANDNSALIREILESRTLLDSLVAEFHIADRYHITSSIKGRTRAVILAKTEFIYAQNSGTFKISYRDIDPVFARDIVNRMIELLDEWFSLNRGLAKQKQRQLLADKIDEVKKEVASLQQRLKALQKQYGVLNVEELGQSQASSLANLRSQLILKEVEIKNYESFSKINDPRLEQLKEERQNLIDLIAQNQVKMPEARNDMTGSQSSSNQRELSLPDVAQQFTQLTLELDIQQRIYNTLSPQYEAAKLTPESEPVFQVLEKAEIPDMKSGPQRMQIVMVALGASLAFSVFLAIFINYLMAQLSIRRSSEAHGRG